MKTPSAFLKSAILLLAALLLGACGDTGGEEPPPNGEPKETFPCEGPWCFDPENNPLAKEAWEHYRELIEPEFFDIYAEAHAACSYLEDENGGVNVRCPDWVMPGLAQCPQNWFQPISVYGQIRLPEVAENALYCFPDTDRTKALRNPFLCVGGYVNPGHAASDFDEQLTGDAVGASCLSPEDCATLEELRWPSQEKSCFYSDFSHISEGELEEVDCSTLAEGECAVNCACPEQPEGLQHLNFSECYHISPRQPVGVCGFAVCHDDTRCQRSERISGQCLSVEQLPDWAQRYVDGREETLGYAVLRGVCVQDEHFANWRNNDNPAYRYGDE